MAGCSTWDRRIVENCCQRPRFKIRVATTDPMQTAAEEESGHPIWFQGIGKIVGNDGFRPGVRVPPRILITLRRTSASQKRELNKPICAACPL
jgi:hypothetical protein